MTGAGAMHQGSSRPAAITAVLLALIPALLRCGPEPGREATARDTAPTSGAVPSDTVPADTVARPGGNCARCHADREEPGLRVPAEQFARSVHGQAGLDCVACHGGDATATSAPAAHEGFLGKPPRRRVPELCSRCHSSAWYMKRYDPDLRVDQMARYRTSVHGRRLLRLGDTRVAVCSDCHSAHSITPSSEEISSVYPQRLPGTCGGCHANPRYMAPYDILTDQLSDYRKSVHWGMVSREGDLSSPVCNDCHGNHGASPPAVNWVGEVCNQCHSRIAGYFRQSPHDSVFAFLGRPGCATCHGNHEILRSGEAMLGLGQEGVCGGSGCHRRGDDGARAALVMRSALDSLTRSYERADSILHVAEQAGMPVSQAQFELSSYRNSLIRARAASHTANLDSVRVAVEAGLEVTSAGYRQGRRALEELEYRRLGLAVSAAIILVLIGGLTLKIRQVEG